MKPSLLDVNLLVALAWPVHVHHAAAHQWFQKNARHGWATSPMTQCGFVRISSNPKIIQDAVTPMAAHSLLRAIVGLPGHVFWPDDVSLELTTLFDGYALTGHRQVSDAYLLALARKHDAQLATLDRGITSLVTPGSPEARAVVVVPV